MTIRELCKLHGGQLATARKLTELTRTPVHGRRVRYWVQVDKMPQWAWDLLEGEK